MDSKILGSSPRMTLWVGLALASTPSSPCPPRKRGSSEALRAGSCSRGLEALRMAQGLRRSIWSPGSNRACGATPHPTFAGNADLKVRFRSDEL